MPFSYGNSYNVPPIIQANFPQMMQPQFVQPPVGFGYSHPMNMAPFGNQFGQQQPPVAWNQWGYQQDDDSSSSSSDDSVEVVDAPVPAVKPEPLSEDEN